MWIKISDYIKREDAITIIAKRFAEALRGGKTIEYSDGMLAAMNDLNGLLAADVAEVRHGRWIQVEETKCRCSNCDIIALIALYPHGDKNFCPNCGARMDEEVRPMYYRICPDCGAHLDPGERCDCQDAKSAAPDAPTPETAEEN